MTLVAVMMFAATFAQAGILVSDRSTPVEATCVENQNDGILVSDREGILVSDRIGILVSDFVSTIFGFEMNEAPSCNGNDGILVSDREGILVSD